MSGWTQQVEQDPIHDLLRSVAAALDTILAQEEERDAETTERLVRLRQVVAHVTARLGSVDSELVTLQTLNNMRQPLQRIASSLETYQTQREPQHVVAAHNELESLLVHSNNLPIPGSVADVEGIREATTSLRRSIGQNIRHLETQSEDARKRLSEVQSVVNSVEARIEKSEQKLADSLSDLQSRFESAEDARSTSFEAALKQLEKKGEEARTQELSKWNESFSVHDGAFKRLLGDAENASEELQRSLESEAKRTLDAISEFRSEAEALVGVITDTGMVGGYQKEANACRRAARLWSGLAAGALGALVVFAVVVFVSHAQTSADTSWADVGWRVFVATAFGLLAAYAARQADKQEKSSRKNRRMELELASISPYLQSLPYEKQIEMKAGLADRLFGQADGDEDRGEDAPTTGTNRDILRMARDIIKSQLRE